MRRALVLALLFAVLSLVLQSYYGYPVTSDAFERMRIADYIASHGQLLQHDVSIIGGRDYAYPPLFDASLALLSRIAQPVETALRIFSVLLTFLFVLSAYLLFLETTRSEKTSLIAASFAALAPLVLLRSITAIPETLGLILLALSLLAFAKRNGCSSFIAMLLLSALSLTHYRTAAVALASMLLFAALSRRIREFAAVAAIPAALLFIGASRVHEVSNQWVVALQPLDVLGAPLIALGIAGVLRNRAYLPRALPLVSLAAVALASLPLIFFPFRQLVYLALPLALFAALLVSNSRKLLVLAIALFIASAAFALAQKQLPVDEYEIDALAHLKQLPGQNVLAAFVKSYAIPYYANKSVVLGAYAEDTPDAQQRISDTRCFFSNCSVAQSQAIIGKYRIDYVLVDKQEPWFTPTWAGNRTPAFENARYAIYPTRPS